MRFLALAVQSPRPVSPQGLVNNEHLSGLQKEMLVGVVVSIIFHRASPLSCFPLILSWFCSLSWSSSRLALVRSCFLLPSFLLPWEQANPDDRQLDDDLRKLLKRLPNSTKRNLLADIRSKAEGGSTRLVPDQARMGGLKDRRASAPMFAAISENAPLEDENKAGSFGVPWRLRLFCRFRR